VLAATHGPPAKKVAGGSYHRSSRNIRHSLRDGFNAYSALSLGTGLSCSHRRAIISRDLASASGGQDHTPSRPPRRRSSAQKTRARRQSVHRIQASRVVTIAIRPSASRRDERTILLICRIKQRPWPATNWHDGQFAHAHHARFARRARSFLPQRLPRSSSPLMTPKVRYDPKQQSEPVQRLPPGRANPLNHHARCALHNRQP